MNYKSVFLSEKVVKKLSESLTKELQRTGIKYTDRYVESVMNELITSGEFDVADMLKTEIEFRLKREKYMRGGKNEVA